MKPKPYGRALRELMAEKSLILSRARAVAEVGLEDAVQPLWAAAASYEERIAPVLETLGRA